MKMIWFNRPLQTNVVKAGEFIVYPNKLPEPTVAVAAVKKKRKPRKKVCK